MIENVKLLEILPTRIWIENGMCGERVVVLQHQDCDPFDYAVFGYDYRYTSNAGTWEAANTLALALGATEPVEKRTRSLPPASTPDELREHLKMIQELLADGEHA
jgi:hypothetical protein